MHKLSQEQLAIREVVNIDIVNDEVDVRVCTSYVFVAVVQTKHCTHCAYLLIETCFICRITELNGTLLK